AQPPDAPLDLPNYAFESTTLFESHRGISRFLRRLLLPLLKLFWNPNPLIQALHIQAKLNTIHAEHETAHRASHHLFYELIHNLVIETTRLAIEVKSLKMRVESLSSRLEFNERRARALESVVAYKSADEELDDRSSSPELEESGRLPPPGSQPGSPGGQPRPGTEGPGQRSRRRRRRRGRRSGPPAATVMGEQPRPAQSEGSTGPPRASGSDSPVIRDDFENVSGA